ncbi:phospholipid/cholesterol/gamma-HCH transport system substrate-binding protein [Crossiella equi]|uniref:Phospholipid/cholesterol/gamma-HCH transport system substrate-binding protein n=1 Tax=Crossiella equi TaxID=130796 RepID=A0ABS5AQ32_9PSEU|nr:MlaD family protein [Crossiella equi]MBP2477790.1 phospholipid/cholesterol/gamma-HCH transport system substrate-binding protein [Crossiella equi]
MRGITGPLLKFSVFAVLTTLVTALLAVTISNATSVGAGFYTARFGDVTSLNEGDDVRMAGVRVGKVEGLRLAGRGVVEVSFSVEGRRRILASATAAIRYRNLVGQRYLALDQGSGTVEPLPPGGVIPIERTQPALDLTMLFNGFKPLFQALNPEDVNKLSYEVVRVLQGEGGTVDSLLARTASLTSTIAGKDKVIGELIGNLNTVLDSVNARGDQLASLISTMQKLVTGLAQDRKPIGEAIGAMADLSGATTDLLKKARPALQADIAGLGKLSANLTEQPDVLEQFLERLPTKLERIGRIGSYGSWFNFFLCSASAPGVPPAQGGPPVGIPLTQDRCKG